MCIEGTSGEGVGTEDLEDAGRGEREGHMLVLPWYPHRRSERVRGRGERGGRPRRREEGFRL